MADSDDEYDRKRRDKFRGERSSGGGGGGGGGGDNYRSDRRGDDRSRGREEWSDRGRGRPDYRDYRGRDRFSPERGGGGGGPPMKRMRGEWGEDGRPRYGGHEGYMPYGGGGWGGHDHYPMHSGGHGAFGGGHAGGGLHARPGASADPANSDLQTQPAMLTLKQFLATQDDSISDSDAITKYNDYKQDFKRQQLNEFFVTHKDEEWFKIKYHPEESNKRKEEQLGFLKNRAAVFTELLESNIITSCSVDTIQTDKLMRILDTVVIKLEGGTDDDLKVLDEKPVEVKPFFEHKVDAAAFKPSNVLQTSDKKNADNEDDWNENNGDEKKPNVKHNPFARKPIVDEEEGGWSGPDKVIPKPAAKKRAHDDDDDDEENWDNDSDTEERPQSTMNDGKSNIVDEDMDKPISSPVQNDDDSEGNWSSDRKENNLKVPSPLQADVDANVEDTQKNDEEPRDNGNKKQRKDRKRSRSDSSSSSSSGSSDSDDGDDNEDTKKYELDDSKEDEKDVNNGKIVENVDENTDDVPKKDLQTEDEQSSATAITEEEKETTVVKIKTEATAEDEEDKVETIDLDKEKDEEPPMKALHKTSSIFLRNLAPTITKSEVETMCKRYNGFLRVAIADPLVERRWFRRGWVTFQRDVNIKEICWNLNNIRLRDCELGAIVNRDLSRRVRPVNGITAHKQIVRSDIKLSAKITFNLDLKAGLWQTDENTKKSDNGNATFGLNSNNPVLQNITDYLIEEASAEEDELLGLATNDSKDTEGELLEKDPQLISVLDKLILYLRIVHSVDFYNHCEYPYEDEMPNRCGIIHARGPAPQNKVTNNEVQEYVRNFEGKMSSFLTKCQPIDEEELKKMGCKDTDAEVEKFVQANTQELAKDKWLCPLSGKKFKGPDFIRKHIFNKHAEKVDEVKKEVEFFNNYLQDVKRPQLPEHPGNVRKAPAEIQQPGYRPAFHPAYAAAPYAGFAPPMAAPRPRGGGFGGRRGGGGGGEYRPIIHYRDLDAPREPDDFL